MSAVLVAAATLFGAAAGAMQAPAAAPSDGWTVEVSLGKCRLVRLLAAEKAGLSIETDAGSGNYILTLGHRSAARVPENSPIPVAIKVDGRVEAKGYAMRSRDPAPFPVGVAVWQFDKGLLDAISAGSRISIAIGRGEIGPLPLPDAGKAVVALRGCEAEQLVEWGADPAQFAPGGSAPKIGDRNALVPQSVMRRVRFPNHPIEPLHYLVLSDAGVVERCAAVYDIPGSDMEQLVCASLVGRKLGEPARDPAGKAVQGVISFSPGLLVTVITRE
jgi:hypothetical protein